MQARAVVGGASYEVGGWGQYEIDRRRVRGAPGAYAGLSHVSAGDAVVSILGGAARARASRRTALQKAAGRLCGALARLEDRLVDPDAVWGGPDAEPGTPAALAAPPLSAADLQPLAEGEDEGGDADALGDYGEAVEQLAAAAGLPPEPPALLRPAALPARIVPADDAAGLRRLERAVAPRVADLERLQAALAARMDTVAAALEKDAAPA